MTVSDHDRRDDQFSDLPASAQSNIADPVPLKKPADVSNLRWRTASAVYKLKGSSLGSGQATTASVSNEGSTRQSTLTHVSTPSPSPYRHVLPLVPISATRLLGKLSSATNWSRLKAALLADGYRVALLQAVVAILINHTRRILVPWLGAFTFYHHPLEDLRLALSNPDVFLNQTLTSCSWTWILLSAIQRWLVNAVAARTTAILLSTNGRVPQADPPDRFRMSSSSPTPGAVTTATLEGLMHLARVGTGVYALTTLDYVFCRSTHTVSCAIALYKLAAGGEAERAVLAQLLETHKARSVLTLCMACHYLLHGLRPAVSAALGLAVRGRPGLLVALLSVVGVVWATIWWRARLYILLEMSPMFVALGALLGVVLLLAQEFVDDPLGLKARTAVVGKTKTRCRASRAERRSRDLGDAAEDGGCVGMGDCGVGKESQDNWVKHDEDARL